MEQTFTRLSVDIVSVKNRSYPEKKGSVFRGETSNSSWERECKERSLGKGAVEVGDWGKQSHGKR